MKILVMVICALAYVLSVTRAMTDKMEMGAAIADVIVNITSFAGMMMILFAG